MSKMLMEEFRSSLSWQKPPEDFSLQEKALWFAGKGEWEQSHDIVQELNDPFSSRIHAFLHRQEGDISNAGYWYSKAGTVQPNLTLDQEWEGLVRNGLGILPQ
jgi:hypothetical protein